MEYGSWRHDAEAEQQRLGDMLGKHLRVFPRSQPLLLKWSVGFALFGPPSHIPTFISGNSASEECDVGYTDVTSIDVISRAILKLQSYSTDVLMSVTFVVVKADGKPIFLEPVFRVPKYTKKGILVKGQYLFVDSRCRVYDGWDDYLCNNRLEEGWFCYPQGGLYQQSFGDRVPVDVSQSPAGKLHRKVLNGLDVAGSAVAIGASAVAIGASALAIAAVAVPAAGVVAGGATVAAVASSAYGVGRSISQLVDRGLHREKVRPSDWLPLVGGVVGIAAAGSNQLLVRAAQRGATVGAVRCAISNGLSVGSMVVNGASVASSIHTLLSKYKNSEKITLLDILQLTVSFFFFTHSVLNFQTAGHIIQQTQELMLTDIKLSLPDEEQRRLFIEMSKTMRQNISEQEANARLIKAFVDRDKVDDFITYLDMISKDWKTSSFATQSQSGVVLDPQTFDESQRVAFLEGVRNILDGKWSRSQFYDNTKLCPGNNFDVNIKDFDLTTALVGLSRFTGAVKTGINTLENVPPECQIIMRNLIMDWVKRVGCTLLGELIEFCEFAIPHVSSILQDMSKEYDYWFQEAMSDNPRLSQQEFDHLHGVVGNRLKHFLEVLTIVYKAGEKFSQLVDEYKQHRKSKLLATVNVASISDTEQPIDHGRGRDTGSKLWVIEWDFESIGDPLSTNCHEIAALILDNKVDASTSHLMHSGEMTCVTLVEDDRVVLIRRMKDRNELLVSVLTEGQRRAVATSFLKCSQ